MSWASGPDVTLQESGSRPQRVTQAVSQVSLIMRSLSRVSRGKLDCLPSQCQFLRLSRYGILIEQNYDGGDLDGGTATSGIPITDLTVENIAGSGAVASTGYDVVITCGSGACSDWTWSNVVVTGGKTYSKCTNVPSGIACS